MAVRLRVVELLAFETDDAVSILDIPIEVFLDLGNVGSAIIGANTVGSQVIEDRYTRDIGHQDTFDVHVIPNMVILDELHFSHILQQHFVIG